MTAPLLTVVICTHNRAQLLERAVAAVRSAQPPAGGAQILVVANACTDGTHEWLRAQESAGAVPLRWLPEPAKGKSHALNLALRTVTSPLVTFVDDDQRVDARFLVALCDAAREVPHAALFCGRLLPDWDGTEPEWVHDRGAYRVYPLPVPHFDLGAEPAWIDAADALPSGGNVMVRSEWLPRIGPFSTTLGPVGHNLGGAEDSEWFLRAFRAGARFRYIPDAVQYHHIEGQRLTLAYLLRMTYQRTIDNVSMDADQSQHSGVPLWAYRKLASYAVHALASFGNRRRRFYLMRSAAALGELQAYRRLARRSAQASHRPSS